MTSSAPWRLQGQPQGSESTGMDESRAAGEGFGGDIPPLKVALSFAQIQAKRQSVSGHKTYLV